MQKFLRYASIASQVCLLFGLASTVNAQTYPPEVQVGARTIIDYEFDWGRDGVYCPSCNMGAGNNRFTFIDGNGNLWVAHVNPDTGGFVPSNGEGVLLDTNTCPPGVTGNGPEWMSLTSASAIVYDKYIRGKKNLPNNHCVGFAHITQDGSWDSGCMDSSTGYVLPIGTFTPGDTKPMVSYQNASQHITDVFWRTMQQGSTQHEVLTGSAQAGVTRRWVTGTHKLFLTAPAPPDQNGVVYRQAFLYSADDGSLEQLTFDPTNKTSGFMWAAPEHNNKFLFFVRIGATEVDIYSLKNNNGGSPTWQIVNRIIPTSDYPFVYSAEPFVYEGKSYIFMSVSAQREGHNLSVTSQIAMTGIDPNEPSYRVLTSDVPLPRARRDPEYYITSNGPYIYYNRYILSDGQPAKPEGVFRIETGLGPQQGALALPYR